MSKDYAKDLTALLTALNDARAKVVNELKQMSLKRAARRGALSISDHAVVRYLERTGRIDAASVRAEIAGLFQESVHMVGADGVWNAQNGLVLIVEGGTVLTVLSQEQSENYLGQSLVDGGVAERIAASGTITPNKPRPKMNGQKLGPITDDEQETR